MSQYSGEDHFQPLGIEPPYLSLSPFPRANKSAPIGEVMKATSQRPHHPLVIVGPLASFLDITTSIPTSLLFARGFAGSRGRNGPLSLGRRSDAPPDMTGSYFSASLPRKSPLPPLYLHTHNYIHSIASTNAHSYAFPIDWPRSWRSTRSRVSQSVTVIVPISKIVSGMPGGDPVGTHKGRQQVVCSVGCACPRLPR